MDEVLRHKTLNGARLLLTNGVSFACASSRLNADTDANPGAGVRPV